jgi:integrase/recombinase XerD
MSSRVFTDFARRVGQKGKPAQTKAAVWAIRKLGSYLALFQFLPHNPAAAISHPKMSPRTKLPEYLTPQELHQLMEVAVCKRPLRDSAVVALLACNGLRPQELALLRLEDVDFKREMLRLTVKGGWVRIMPMARTMVEQLRDYVQHTQLPGERLFYNDWGNPIDKRWVLRLVKGVGREAGIKRVVTPRMMRHTFATYMADRHGKEVTRALMGHGASRSTDVYMHLVPGKFRQYAKQHPYNKRKKRGAS